MQIVYQTIIKKLTVKTISLPENHKGCHKTIKIEYHYQGQALLRESLVLINAWLGSLLKLYVNHTGLKLI